MKNGILIFLLIFISWVNAQNKINRYEYWFDDNYASKVTTNITPTPQFFLNTNIPTSSLAHGLHTFHIRFRDDSLRWSVVSSQFFYKMPSTTSTTAKLTQYEYWFDDNYAAKVTNNFSGNNAQEQVLTNISTTSLSNGLHSFHIRFKDNTGKWSVVSSQFFYKMGSSTPTTAKLTQYEYWFDDNYASKVTNNFSGNNAQEQVLTNITTTSLSNGLHSFHIRFKDNTGKWSVVSSQFFYKMPSTTSITAKLTQYEYWFDDNYAAKVTVNFSGNNSQEQVLTNITTTSLSNGLHSFHIRFKDNTGKWSVVSSQFFYKMPSTNLASNFITGYRYWFDDDLTSQINVYLTTPTPHSQVIQNLDLNPVRKGQHLIHFQFKDTLQQWSVVVTDTILKQPNPIARFILSDTIICQGYPIDFTSISYDADQHFWNLGNGVQKTDSSFTYIYNQPGIYTVSLMVNDTATGKTHTLTQNIYVLPHTQSNITENACRFYNAPNGQVITQSGNYVFVIPNSFGCDSTINLQLTVNHIDTTVNQSNNTLTALQSNASYQWLDCNNNFAPITGANSSIFIPTVNGNYAVQITYNGCMDTSSCHEITGITSLLSSTSNNIFIYPNPTHNLIYIDFTAPQNNVLLELYDMNGKLVQNQSFGTCQNLEWRIEQAIGVYQLVIKTQDKIHSFKIIKN